MGYHHKEFSRIERSGKKMMTEGPYPKGRRWVVGKVRSALVLREKQFSSVVRKGIWQVEGGTTTSWAKAA